MGLSRRTRALPLVLLLLAAVPIPARPRGLCPALCRCHRRLLDCSRALPARNGSGGSGSAAEGRAWRGHLWAEALVLQDNGLQAVKRHSLEGLLLLKHLDLSHNKILLVEEAAFEPLPFLQLLNLDGNLLTQLWNGTFQAWHGMQFLERLILSHNPLTVIADTSFFRLPSLKYLDLSATEVTQQSLLRLLLTAAHLETLKVPRDVACCLCQKKHTTGTPCRTIKFHCQDLCPTSSAPQCAPTDPLAEAEGEIVEAAQSRSLNSSTMLKLQPQEPSLQDPDTVTLAVVLSLTSSGGDVSNSGGHIPTSDFSSPQHLSRQESRTIKELLVVLHRVQHLGWSSEAAVRKLHFLAKALVAELKKKLQEAKSDLPVANTLPAPPEQQEEVQETPAVERETNMGWEQEQHGLGLKLWAAAGRSDPTAGSSRQHRGPKPPPEPSLPQPPAPAPRLSEPFEDPNDLDAVEQTKKALGMEAVEDAERAASPRQDYVWTYKGHRQRHSPDLAEHHQLFHRAPEEEPSPTEGEAEQRPTPNQHFSSNNSPPAASSTLEDTAEEGSSPSGHLLGIPHTAETHWMQGEEGSSFPNKPGSSESPDRAVEGDLFEAKVQHQLRLLVPDEALRSFVAQLARALKGDCSLPQLQPACAKLLLKTGLLIKLLSQRQEEQGASVLEGQCVMEGNVSIGVPKEEKAKYTFSDLLLLAPAVAVVVVVNLLLICLAEVHSRKRAAASHPLSSRKSHQRWFFHRLLPRGWSRNKDAGEQSSLVWNPSKIHPQWLQDLFKPLNPQQERAMAELCQDSSDEEIFSRSQAPFSCWKSRAGQEIVPPEAPGPMPSISSTPQEVAQGFCAPEEGAEGSPVLGIPQSSSQ